MVRMSTEPIAKAYTDHAREEYCPFFYVDEPARFGLKQHYCDTIFGSMRYFVTGPARPDASVTLLLHGVGGSWSTWSHLLQQIQVERRGLPDLLIVEIPGFGASENNRPDLPAGLVADVLVKLIHDLGWTKFRVIGHSMGGFLALDLAARNPTGLSGVAVISGFYFTIIDTVKSPWLTLVRSPKSAATYVGFALLSMVNPKRHPRLKRLHDGLLPWMMRGLAAHPSWIAPTTRLRMASSGGSTSFKKAARNAIGYDPDATWGTISVPLLAIGGAHDKMVPPKDLRRLARSSHARTVEISEAGHFAHIERPAEVLSLLTQFELV